MPQPDNIIVSVIYPLYDHRNKAIECFNTWANNQTYPRKNYEVVVISNGDEPVLEQELQAQLLPQDRMIISSGETNPMVLYDLGVRQARGDWLIFCEAHSEGEPTCIEEFVNYVLNEQMDGACCHYVGINQNNIAEMEEKIFTETRAISLQPEHWNKLHLRGSILRRSAYLAIGGFMSQYGLFSEALLVSSLHKHGYKLGYTDKAVVRHYNVDSINRMSEIVSDYVRSECQYYQDFPTVFNEPYFEKPANWQDQGWLDQQLIYHLWVASGKSHRFHRWLALLPFVLIGPRWNLLKAKIAVFIAAWKCRLLSWHKRWLWSAYKKFCNTSLINQNQFQFFLQQDNSANNSAKSLQIGKYESMATIADRSIWGFHPHEIHQGISFRWSKPDAVAKFIFEPGDYSLRLVIAPFRSEPSHLQIFFNGKRMTQCVINSQGEIQIHIQKNDCNVTHSQYVVILCQPFKPVKYGSTDNRHLGLALSQVCLEKS